LGAPLDTTALCKHWVHSREEDTNTVTVYRPANYSFPPSRGRTGLEFGTDGTFKRIGIGQTDISRVAVGTWQVEGKGATEVHVQVDDSRQVLEIGSLDHDRLTIKKPA